MFTVAKGMIPVSGDWLDALSGTGMGTGSIWPLRFVSRIAMALPSGCVIITATFSNGILALLVNALTCMYPVDARKIPPFKVQNIVCMSNKKVQGSQVSLHLLNIDMLTVQKLLGKTFDITVGSGKSVLVLKSNDHAAGVTLDHHSCNFRVIAAKT